MSESAITHLNRNCLTQILLHLDFPQRIKFREVCRAWRDISDDVWDGPKEICIEDSPLPNDEDEETPHHSCKDKKLSLQHDGFRLVISDLDIVEQVLKRFGTNIISLIDDRYHRKDLWTEMGDNFVLPLGIQYCPNVRLLKTLLTTEVDERNLVRFASKTRIEQLNLTINIRHTLDYFDQIPTDALQLINFTWFYLVESPTPLSYGYKQFLLNCSRLRVASLDHVDDQVLEIIGQKRSLWRLQLYLNADDWEMEEINLSPLLQLSNLRELSLQQCDPHYFSTPYVTDDFLAGVAEHLQLLEVLDVDVLSASNYGITSLATLKHLRKLKFNICQQDEPITEWARLSHIDNLELVFCGLQDEHAIDILKKSKTIRVLNLSGCEITNHALLVAMNVTKSRTNGIVLTFDVSYTQVNSQSLENFRNTSPFLKIIEKFDPADEHNAAFPVSLESLNYSEK